MWITFDLPRNYLLNYLICVPFIRIVLSFALADECYNCSLWNSMLFLTHPIAIHFCVLTDVRYLNIIPNCNVPVPIL